MIGEATNKKDESKVGTVTSTANCISFSLRESNPVTRVNVVNICFCKPEVCWNPYIET